MTALAGSHVGLYIDNIFSEVGSSALLHSFFSTISFHLEPEGWGTRFPELMNELYRGKLEPSAASKTLSDAQSIKAELARLPVDRVVWDIENVHAKPPWGDYVDASVKSLADYHITSTRRVLMDLLIECVEFQALCAKPLEIITLDELGERMRRPST